MRTPGYHDRRVGKKEVYDRRRARRSDTRARLTGGKINFLRVVEKGGKKRHLQTGARTADILKYRKGVEPRKDPVKSPSGGTLLAQNRE